MTEKEFNRLYVKLVSSVQLIELRLRFILSNLSCGFFNPVNEDYFENIQKVSGDTIFKLLKLICSEQEKKNEEVLNKEILDRVNSFRKSRNFWIHECFIKGCIGFNKDKNGELKLIKEEYAIKLKNDEKEAYLLNEDLFNLEQDMKD